MKILIIGGGNMGLTYAKSFLKSHSTSSQDMMILEKSADKADQLARTGVGLVYAQAEQCIPLADLIILAVKPQDCATLFGQISHLISPQQVFLSIMAGVKIETIKQQLKAEKIIRAMPNLPAQIGMGMTAITSTDAVTRLELVMVQNLLNTTGKTVYVEQEHLIDTTTAVSGSGPAYVWFFMQAMIEAARKMGFAPAEAELLVTQTFKGTIDLYSKSNYSCEEWIAKVASKGGTTEAALHTFQELAVKSDIEKAMQAALDRAVYLGHKN